MTWSDDKRVEDLPIKTQLMLAVAVMIPVVAMGVMVIAWLNGAF